MSKNTLATFFILLINSIKIFAETQQRPNIIIIIADDMGFNDVGFHGSNQIPTPNIDALAYYGIILNRHYAPPVCTPSRASLLTGKYPTKLGLQHYVIDSDEPWGLGLTNKLLPQYLKDVGYRTHLIGKWHLGFYRKIYTPTMRGFDTHLGFVGPFIDYWDHTRLKLQPEYELGRGLDMRANLSVNQNTKGVYVTDLITEFAIETIRKHDKSTPMFMQLSHLAPHCGNADDPLQAPAEEINRLNNIKNVDRRRYAAMVSRLDSGIGKVIDALDQENMLNNSVILFVSDNGAPTEGEYSNAGSNAPFRGQKNSPYDGAVHTASFIWSPLLKSKERVSNQLIHISDWFSTFTGLAGINLTDRNIDGLNMWNALSHNLESPRVDALCDINNVVPFISYINGYWKYVNGTTANGKHDKWLGDFENDNQTRFNNMEYINQIQATRTAKILKMYRSVENLGILMSQSDIENLRDHALVKCNRIANPIACKPLESECLFNLKDDPCETNNLAVKRPDIIKLIKSRLKPYFESMVKPRNKPGDPRSNPANFNDTWTWWYDELHINEDNGSIRLFNIKILILIFGIHILILVFNKRE